MEPLRKSPTLATLWSLLLSPLLIFSLLTFNCVTLSLAANRLYDVRDNVIQVDHLKIPLLEPGVGKLVQFMNGFCNDSQGIIPTYTQVARDLYKWNRILKFYVIDCANAAATNDCREYMIRETPTFLYFPSQFSSGHGQGTAVDFTVMQLVKHTVASYLSQLEHHVSGQPRFELLTLQDNVSTVFDVSSRSHLVLVHQPKGSTIGRDTILDLLPYRQMEVRILEDRRIFLNFGVEMDRYPIENLVVIDRAGKLYYLSPENPMENLVEEEERHYLPDEHPTEEANVFAVERLVQPPPQKVLEPHQPVNLNASLRKIIFDNYRTRWIYKADLERAIDRILRVQLVQVSGFRDQTLIVLQNLMTLLQYFNPLDREEGKVYINDIYVASESLVNGDVDHLNRFLLSERADKSYYGDRYVGCIASKPGLRGFNCSLWTLFHYFTVAASRPPILFKPGVVLWTLHGYLNYFMGCPECYKNFWLYAQERNIDDVKTHDEEILWLWEAHNHFNKKLAGDRTEDPRFPKKQFPLDEDCPKCRYSKAEVLKHLKEIYSLENLNWLGLSTTLSYLHNPPALA